MIVYEREQRRPLSDESHEDSPGSLTCIHPRIHSAAPVGRDSHLDEIQVEAFLEAMVDVAFAVASRQTGQDEEERQK